MAPVSAFQSEEGEDRGSGVLAFPANSVAKLADALTEEEVELLAAGGEVVFSNSWAALALFFPFLLRLLEVVEGACDCASFWAAMYLVQLVWTCSSLLQK